jgi:hypothetical protein
MMTRILALDQSTSATKALVYDLKGELLDPLVCVDRSVSYRASATRRALSSDDAAVDHPAVEAPRPAARGDPNAGPGMPAADVGSGGGEGVRHTAPGQL